MTVRVEIRKPPKGGHLRVAAGRVDSDSPIGIGRHFFFDDVPMVIEALIRAWESSLDTYTQMEIDRVERAKTRDMERIRERISNDPSDWRYRILQLREKTGKSDDVPSGDAATEEPLDVEMQEAPVVEEDYATEATSDIDPNIVA